MGFNKTIISTDKAPAAVGTYSQGVFHNGVYYFSGQIGLDAKTGEMPAGFDAIPEPHGRQLDSVHDSRLVQPWSEPGAGSFLP